MRILLCLTLALTPLWGWGLRGHQAINRAAVRTLPEEQRLVLALVTLEGLSYRETAERLSVPIGTVMSRLARARRKLVELAGGAITPAAANVA